MKYCWLNLWLLAIVRCHPRAEEGEISFQSPPGWVKYTDKALLSVQHSLLTFQSHTTQRGAHLGQAGFIQIKPLCSIHFSYSKFSIFSLLPELSKAVPTSYSSPLWGWIEQFLLTCTSAWCTCTKIPEMQEMHKKLEGHGTYNLKQRWNWKTKITQILIVKEWMLFGQLSR